MIKYLFISFFLFMSSLGLTQTPTYSLKLDQFKPDLRLKLENQFGFNYKALLPQQVDQIIQFIHLKENLQSVHVFLANHNQIEIKMIPLPQIKTITWQNAEPDQISELNKVSTLKVKQVFNREQIEFDLEKTKEAFIAKGYREFSYKLETSSSENNLVDLKITPYFGPLTRISDIQIQCRSETLKKELSKIVNSYINAIYRDEDMLTIKQKILEYLSDHDHIRAEVITPQPLLSKGHETVTLFFQIEKEEHYKLKFFGNKNFSSSKLTNALELQSFFSASSRIDAELSNRLKRFYLSEAFARVEIQSSETIGKSEFEKIIEFHITENPRIKIKSINFSGVYAQSESYYLALLKKVSTDLIKDRFYFRESLEVSLQSFIKEIQEAGYLQAKIISFRSNYDEEKTSVQININFDEGPQTFIEKILITGNSQINTQKIKKALKLNEKEPFQLRKLESAIQILKNIYYESGFIEMNLTNEFTDLVKYSEDNTKALINFNIFEGPQVRVASIVIDGNQFTQDHVILNEISLKVGDLVTPDSLEESQLNLQRTGFFNTVSVKTLEEKTTATQRTLIIKVTERDPGLFTLGLGATNERGLTVRAYTGVAYNNLQGTGRGLSLRLEGSYNLTLIKYPQSKIILGYLEPYIFNSNIKGRVSLTRNEFISDYDTKQATILNQVTFNLEKRWTQQISGIWNLWSLSTVRDFGISSEGPADTSVNIGSFGPYLDLDYRDNPFQPTRGFLARVSYEYGDPYIGSSETINYWLANASLTHYKNLTPLRTNPIIFANQFRAGHIENVSTHPNGGVPYDKKGFILGSRDTIRGFEAGTSESFPNQHDLGTTKYLLKTKSDMLLVKSELRFPIYKELGGAIFYDGGMVFIDRLPFEDYYRDSAGFGIRYNTPIGAVNLEIGFKLDKKSYESKEHFHLSIGTF